MRSRNLVLVVVAGLLIGSFLGTSYKLPFLDDKTAGPSNKNFSNNTEVSHENAIFDIDSSAEWFNQSGLIWTPVEARFDDGRLRIGEFGVWQQYGYRSVISYRTRQIDVSGNSIQLDKLVAKGYIGRPDAALLIQLRSCNSPLKRGSAQSIISCNRQNGTFVYNSTLITEPGPVNIEKNLSNAVITDYLHVYAQVFVNTTEPVREENATYWDSIRLTKK